VGRSGEKVQEEYTFKIAAGLDRGVYNKIITDARDVLAVENLKAVTARIALGLRECIVRPEAGRCWRPGQRGGVPSHAPALRLELFNYLGVYVLCLVVVIPFKRICPVFLIMVISCVL
jgi:hypothetical protein